MARPLRIERVGGWYHVTSRGNERKAIVREDTDRAHVVALLEEMVSRFRLRLHVYVLMENHFHLLVELTEANLSRAMQWLQLSYGMWFTPAQRPPFSSPVQVDRHRARRLGPGAEPL